MIALADEELLSVWASARTVPAVMRPAALLELLGAEADAARLPIGTRDRRLLALRETSRGCAFEGVAACPACTALVELSFDAPPAAELRDVSSIAIGDVQFVFRLPNTNDLAAIGAANSIDDARTRLAQRCVVRATRDGLEVAALLDEETVAALSAAMSDADPDGDIALAVVCPDCAHEWDVLFDPAAYVWHELESAAVAAVREVDALASAYGWSESDILSIPASRRRMYLGMVLG